MDDRYGSDRIRSGRAFNWGWAVIALVLVLGVVWAASGPDTERARYGTTESTSVDRAGTSDANLGTTRPNTNRSTGTNRGTAP